MFKRLFHGYILIYMPNHIVMKSVRIILLLLILLAALYSGWFVYGLVFELLDFQIGTYRMLLQTGEQLWAAKDAVWWVIEQAIGLFGGEWVAVIDQDVASDMQVKLARFESKLYVFSSIMWVLACLLVRKVLSTIVFGLKNNLNKISEFLG